MRHWPHHLRRTDFVIHHSFVIRDSFSFRPASQEPEQPPAGLLFVLGRADIRVAAILPVAPWASSAYLVGDRGGVAIYRADDAGE